MTEAEERLREMATLLQGNAELGPLADQTLHWLDSQAEIGYDKVADCLALFPELTSNEAVGFIRACEESRLAWRMGDAWPAISELDDGTRTVTPREKHRVVVDAFDQWCRLLGAQWDAQDWNIVTDTGRKWEFGAGDEDMVIVVRLRDWVVNTLYVRNLEMFLDSARKVNLMYARDMWFENAGLPPGPTITQGYGVYWGGRETLDPKYGKDRAFYARKRAERHAMAQRAPHSVSMRRNIEVDATVYDIIRDLSKMTPEEVVRQYALNAKRLGRTDINTHPLI